MSVLMLASAIDVKLNLKPLDYGKKEHHSPEFLKINPQHTLPTLVEGDLKLWESRAIMIYLVEKYSTNEALYPKDLKTRALVHQRLYFDMGTLYEAIGETYFPTFEGAPISDEKMKKLIEAVALLDGHDYVVNNQRTIADISISVSIGCIEAFNFDLKPFPKVTKWLKLMKKSAGYSEVKSEIEALKGFFEMSLNNIKK
jgi:glutathione S-transferase